MRYIIYAYACIGEGFRDTSRQGGVAIAGGDIYVDIEIPYATAISGGQQKFKISRHEDCVSCDGTFFYLDS